METVTAVDSHSPVDLEFEPAALIGGSQLQDDSALADAKGLRIGILIVTYNALSTILPVLKRITPNVWRNVEEVVIFDDASRDATFELAVGLKTLRKLSKLTVLKHTKNLGYGGNQKAGYRYFLERGMDVVVLLHGDGQYAPEILAHMYHPIVAGKADAVFGSRMMRTYGGPLKGGMPLYKYVGNRILTSVENKMLGMTLTEFHSGYRAFNLHALREIDFTGMTDDFHFDTEIIIKLHHQRFRITEVPIPTYYGDEICHVNGLKYAKDVVRAVYRYRKTCRSLVRHREFEEYFVHYPVKQMSQSSHYWGQRLTGSNKEVLDIGCGNGFLAGQLAANGNRVTGMDSLLEPSESQHLTAYHQLDLDDASGVLPLLNGKQFDCVLLLDILEHLRTPDKLLQACARAVKPNGQIIVSLPNIANIAVRLMLLFGRFDYTDRGILDKTHLRFFTFRSGRRLLESCGLEIIDVKATLIPIELLLPLNPANRFMRFLNGCLSIVTGRMKKLLGYQMVFVARPRGSANS